MQPLLDFAGFATNVAESLGPGRRLVMWVRGCQRRCAGCISPELQKPGIAEPLGPIVDKLLPLLADMDGLTISGGEPFDQAETLVALLDILRAQQDCEVLVYTGYTIEELHAGDAAWDALLQRIDLLIDGVFIEEQSNNLQWRGSDNQRVHLLSPRAQRYAATKDLPMPETRPVQVQQVIQGQYRVIGILRRDDLKRYRAAMAARGMKIEE